MWYSVRVAILFELVVEIVHGYGRSSGVIQRCDQLFFNELVEVGGDVVARPIGHWLERPFSIPLAAFAFPLHYSDRFDLLLLYVRQVSYNKKK